MASSETDCDENKDIHKTVTRNEEDGWSDWSEIDLEFVASCEKQEIESISDSSDDVPLIKFTTRRSLLIKHKARKTKLKLQSIKKSIKSAVKILKRKPKKNRKNNTKRRHCGGKRNYRPTSSNKVLEEMVESDIDDSGDEYKPTEKDVNSSDSDSQLSTPSSTTLQDIKTSGKRCRNRKHTIAKSIIPPKRRRKSNIIQNSPKTLKAIRRSKYTQKIRNLLLKYHTARLDNLLTSNGLKRIPVYPDGNCFFNALLPQLQIHDHAELRRKVTEHLKEYKCHYISFLPVLGNVSEDQREEEFVNSLNYLHHNGHWDANLGDCMPLAVANVFKRPLRIYSSRIENAVYDILPDLAEYDKDGTTPLNLALFSIPRQEHYDSVCTLNSCKSPSGQPNRGTPVHTTPRTHPQVTPRKRANYTSPVKKQLFRKKRRNPEKWKRNIRKNKRSRGEAYVGRTGKFTQKKQMNYINCDKCKFKCSQKVSEYFGKEIFSTYWNLGTYEKQRNFICQNVDQTDTRRCKTKRKSKANSFHLPGNEKRVRVCKKFFLGILNIGKKTVDYALKKKLHGVFVGEDLRGRKPSINKTPERIKRFVKEHIESFPTVSSHYTRKDTQRKYLNANLSVKKMYQLYKAQCKELGTQPCSMNIYREIFCNEFNFSFHKPKKDQCIVCSVYDEKKKQGNVTEQDEKMYAEHQSLKENSRAEKRADKERAQADRSFVAATFDLEAVLPTPNSKVGDLYYKRCLSSYNLSVYSLGDKKGTCYLWDETNGGRGSCEIGTCLLLHINSVAEKCPDVHEITYYSDTCGGQNRNQFVSAGMFFALHHHTALQAINHKFFEKGHSEMESDSIHAAVERAKRNTNVYHPSKWDTLVSVARQKNPYIVIPLSYKDFYDLKSLRKSICKNMKTTTDGARVNWLKVKWIRVTKRSPESMFLNYSFNPTGFMEVKFCSRGRGRQVNVSNFELQPLYCNKLPVSKAKKADLISVCKSGVIPSNFHSFYEELPADKALKTGFHNPTKTRKIRIQTWIELSFNGYYIDTCKCVPNIQMTITVNFKDLFYASFLLRC